MKYLSLRHAELVWLRRFYNSASHKIDEILKRVQNDGSYVIFNQYSNYFLGYLCVLMKKK
ncbi:MAG: hypothetical protein KGV44_00630 [Flavobacteriaceae bacterium]|nr:hypothetical protein [Flavobacteriaceae bacterium]